MSRLPANDALAVAKLRELEVHGPLNDMGPRLGADSGTPHIHQLEIFSDDRMRCGVWESTPGGWRIEDRDVSESMFILNGRIRLTADGEDPVEFGAGDAVVLPAGWAGRWETVETVRKVYTVS